VLAEFCTSHAVIDRLAIKTAFAIDERFLQLGTVRVVP